MAKALSLSYCRLRYNKVKRLCNFPHISMMKTRCCQEDNLPDFGNSVISEISQIEPDLDVGERLSNPLEIQKNMQSRKLQHISVQKLAIKYSRLMKLSLEKQSLEQERKSLSQTIRNMITEKKQKEEVERSKEMARELREKHDTAVKSLHGIQNEVRLLAFGLPNVLSEKTPVDNEVILESHGSTELQDGKVSISHIDLARKTDMIKFSSAGDRVFYFLGELAETQQNLLSYFSARMAEHGFVPIAAPDFCKDFVIEGCGRRRDLTYKMQQPHVDKEIQYNVLGASEASFAAYLTKMTISQKALPLQLVSTGPSYDSVSNHKYPGLFAAAQTSKTNLFGVYSTLQDCYDKFEELQQLIVQLYKDFDVPIRLVLCPAHKLKLSEEIRAELQIWTPSLQEYLSVASISVLGDYISRRLAVRPLGNREFEATRLQMVYGEILDTTKLIAVLVEFGTTNKETGSYQMKKLNFLNQYKKSM